MIALLASALAADPLADAVETELARAIAELRLPEAPGPWFVSAVATEGERFYAGASFGSATSDARVLPYRDLGVMVRTGDATLDNTNFDVRSEGGEDGRLVRSDDALAIRHDVWLLLDDQYKAAVEALAAKTAARARRAEPVEVPSFVPGAPVVAEEPAVDATIDGAALGDLVRGASEAFLDHPKLEIGTAGASVRVGRRVVLDTGGTRVTGPDHAASVRLVARVRAADGAVLADQVQHLARTQSDLPGPDALRAEAHALAARLEAWSALPAEDEEYVGPVLIEGDAAVDLFRLLLLPALSGTPPVETAPRGSRVVVWDDQGTAGPMRLKRRILPPGWSVVDDPTADPTSPASYLHDDEGVPARRVELVRDGVVRDHLMSRIPSRALAESNGHGRGGVDDAIRGAPAIASVVPDRVASARRLHREALALAADYGLDHYLVIRRFAQPGLERVSGGAWVTGRSFFGFDDRDALPAPIEVVRVSRDGGEVALRGLELGGVDLRSLADVVLAGASATGTFESGDYGVGVPVKLTAPAVLLSEAELVPSTAPSQRPPRVPSPLATTSP